MSLYLSLNHKSLSLSSSLKSLSLSLFSSLKSLFSDLKSLTTSLVTTEMHKSQSHKMTLFYINIWNRMEHNRPDLPSKKRVNSVQPVVKVAVICWLQKKTTKLRRNRECITLLQKTTCPCHHAVNLLQPKSMTFNSLFLLFSCLLEPFHSRRNWCVMGRRCNNRIKPGFHYPS